jgi:hypothetical protein
MVIDADPLPSHSAASRATPLPLAIPRRSDGAHASRSGTSLECEYAQTRNLPTCSGKFFLRRLGREAQGQQDETLELVRRRASPVVSLARGGAAALAHDRRVAGRPRDTGTLRSPGSRCSTVSSASCTLSGAANGGGSFCRSATRASMSVPFIIIWHEARGHRLQQIAILNSHQHEAVYKLKAWARAS